MAFGLRPDAFNIAVLTSKVALAGQEQIDRLDLVFRDLPLGQLAADEILKRATDGLRFLGG